MTPSPPVHRPTRVWRLLAACAVGFVWTALPAKAAAQKTDVVALMNGDRVTCEIKKLDRGKLTVGTDGIGTIAIEWNDVASVSSAAQYDIEQESGRRLFGSLVPAGPGAVDIVSSSSTERVALSTIVRISPLGGTFWRRLDGAVNAGFNFTQANVQTQWTAHSEVRYRSPLWVAGVSADSALTTREDADRQTRNTVTVQAMRFLRPRWSALGFTYLDQNEELSLEFRVAVGGGIERALARSNRVLATVLVGAAFTREAYSDADEESVAEAVLGTGFEWFTFDGRSTNLAFSALSFYALRDDSRLRLELTSKFKSDIVGDLYWSIDVFNSLNSDPPPDRKRNDAGVSAAVGWSF